MSTNEKDPEKALPVWSGSGAYSVFERWQMLLKAKMKTRDMWAAIETAVTDQSTADEQKVDQKAQLLIFSCTNGTAFNMIKKLENAKLMWDKLHDRFGTAPNDEDLASELFERWAKLNKMKSNDEYLCPDNWMEGVTNCAADLESLNTAYKKDEREIKSILANGLPSIYNEKGIRRDLLKDVNDANVTAETVSYTHLTLPTILLV